MSKSFTIIISSYKHAGLNLDFGIIRAFESSSDRLYVTPVEFSTKITFQGYSQPRTFKIWARSPQSLHKNWNHLSEVTPVAVSKLERNLSEVTPVVP